MRMAIIWPIKQERVVEGPVLHDYKVSTREEGHYSITPVAKTSFCAWRLYLNTIYLILLSLLSSRRSPARESSVAGHARWVSQFLFKKGYRPTSVGFAR